MQMSLFLQCGRDPYVAMGLNITSIFQEFVGPGWTSAPWFIWKRLQLAVVDSVQQWRKDLPGSLDRIETIGEEEVIHELDYL